SKHCAVELLTDPNLAPGHQLRSATHRRSERNPSLNSEVHRRPFSEIQCLSESHRCWSKNQRLWPSVNHFLLNKSLSPKLCRSSADATGAPNAQDPITAAMI